MSQKIYIYGEKCKKKYTLHKLWLSWWAFISSSNTLTRFWSSNFKFFPYKFGEKRHFAGRNKLLFTFTKSCMKYVQYSMFYALQRALIVFLCNAFSEENEIIQFASESKYLANNMVYIPKFWRNYKLVVYFSSTNLYCQLITN